MALTVVVLTASLANAQDRGVGTVRRIGWLAAPSAASGAFELKALEDGLRASNYVNGGNVTIEARWGNGDLGRLPVLARELVGLKVDLIFTAGTPATLAAKAATGAIPIVFGRVAFPDRTGVVVSLARPGGNATGVTFIGPEYGKRLEVLREVVQGMSRVALLYNDKNPASVLAMNETRQAGTTLGVVVDPLGVHDDRGLEAAFTAMRSRRPDGLMTTADSVVASYRTSIVAFAAQHRLASMYADRVYLEAGGLLFFGTSLVDTCRHAAIYADRIFKGAKPGELPVEQPTKFELLVNLRAARSLGLTIPASVLWRADQVVEW